MTGFYGLDTRLDQLGDRHHFHLCLVLVAAPADRTAKTDRRRQNLELIDAVFTAIAGAEIGLAVLVQHERADAAVVAVQPNAKMRDAAFDVVALKHQVDRDLLVSGLRVLEDDTAKTQLLIHDDFPSPYSGFLNIRHASP